MVGRLWLRRALYFGGLLKVRGTVLSPKDFFSGLRKGLQSTLPPDLRKFETGRGHGRLMKIHFEHPQTHFEVWHHAGAGRLEVGLHFEGSRDLNLRAFDFFRARMVEVKAGLPHAELEPWDRGWSRLYETIPAPRLDDHVVEWATDVLADYVTTLQPLLKRFWKEVE